MSFLSGGGGFLPPVTAKLVGDIHDFSAKMAEARGEMSATEKSGSSSFQKLQRIGRTALIAIGTVAVAVGGESVHLADKWEEAHARLVVALRNSGSSWADWAAGVDKAQSKLEGWGFTNAEVQNALARLVPVTHSQTEALTLQSLAADIARARHMDLESATQLLVKVQTGHVSLLGRLGIQTKDATGATISQQDAIALLTKMYGGSASEAAGTFQGKLKALEAKLQDLGVKIGQFLIPIIEQLVGWVMTAVHWLGQHRDIALILGITIGTVLIAAIAAYIVSMIQAAAVTIAATWPIIAIIAAIALLVATAVFFATKWNEIWTWIQNNPAYAALIAILAFLVAPILLIGAIIGIVAANWQTAWDWIQTAATNAAHWIVGVFYAVLGFFTGIPGFIEDLGASMWNGISDGFNSVIHFIKAIWNDFVDFWNSIQIHVPSVHLPLIGDVGGFTIGLPDLPHARRLGGPVAPYGTYIVGEQGPELLQMGRAGGMVQPNSALAGGSTIVNITMNGLTGAHAVDTVNELNELFKEAERRGATLVWRTPSLQPGR